LVSFSSNGAWCSLGWFWRVGYTALGCRYGDLFQPVGQSLCCYPADHPELWPEELYHGVQWTTQKQEATIFWARPGSQNEQVIQDCGGLPADSRVLALFSPCPEIKWHKGKLKK
jgi:hypothetical protein|tara:strand:- start:526 stop:867 length:342 start_codon:yes stop_codon:yes gene_type:complete